MRIAQTWTKSVKKEREKRRMVLMMLYKIVEEMSSRINTLEKTLKQMQETTSTKSV